MPTKIEKEERQDNEMKWTSILLFIYVHSYDGKYLNGFCVWESQTQQEMARFLLIWDKM